VIFIGGRNNELYQQQKADSGMTRKDAVRSNVEVGKRLLTVKEAAALLGLAQDTVYRKARLRELPSVKVGRSLRFDLEALDRYIERHSIKTLD
jgi:excisionase family DNA binding protein